MGFIKDDDSGMSLAGILRGLHLKILKRFPATVAAKHERWNLRDIVLV